MKILISGGSGMVGKNLIELLSLNNDIDILSPSSKELNLLEFKNTLNYLENNRPDLVIHCAGRVGGIQANIKNPVNFLVDNLDMGRNLVMASKKSNIKKFLNLGSSCMYPRSAKNPLNEELILQGELEPTNEGYALAKITIARLCEYINKEDESFLYKTIIPCNLYGKFDKFDPQNSHMIPAVIRKIHEAKLTGSKDVDIWGDGEARREFMIATDLSDFIIYAIQNFKSLPTYLNVGLGRDYTINEYYKAIAEVIGWQGEFVHDLSKPVGMKQKVVDIERLNNFGWKSKTSLHEGIKLTYKYFLENYGTTK